MSWDDFDAPEDTGFASDFLETEGIFALQITGVHPDANHKGELNDGVLGVNFVVVGCTMESDAGKAFSHNFYGPKLNDSDKSAAFKKRKITALLIAADAMTPDELGKKLNLSQRFPSLDGRVVVAKLVKNEAGYLEINYSDIWHVDDPKASGKHLTDVALKLVAKEHRHEAAYFAKIRKDPHKGTPVKPRNVPDDLFSDL